MKFRHTQHGFTFVETLVAIAILLIALVSPLTIVSKTSQSNTLANEQIIAFFLAQEGVELAQQLRDQASLIYRKEVNDGNSPTDAWLSALALHNPAFTHFATCSLPSGCGLYRFKSAAGDTPPNGPAGLAKPQAAAPVSCAVIANCKLSIISYPAVGTVYAHDVAASANATTTPFTRVIRYVATSQPDEVEIVSTVTWRAGLFFQEQQIQVRTSIFNVYEN